MSVGERYSSASVAGSCTTTRSDAALSSLSRNATVMGLSGCELHAAGCAIELGVDGHPDGADLLARRHQQRPNLTRRAREERLVLPPRCSVTLKMRLVTASGRPVAVIGPADGRADSRAFVRTVSTGMTSS